jgi:hypothetical protein
MYNATTNRANSNPAPFSVVLSRVGINDKQASKDLFCLSEIKTVLADAGSILCVIPYENHCNSKRSYRQNMLLGLSGIHRRRDQSQNVTNTPSSGRRKHYFPYKSPMVSKRESEVWITFANFSNDNFQVTQPPIQCSWLRFAAPT